MPWKVRFRTGRRNARSRLYGNKSARWASVWDGFDMDCRCGTAACRGVVRGRIGGAPTCESAARGWFPGGSAEDRTNPGPPELIAPDEERRTGTSARSVPAAREFERSCQGTPVAAARMLVYLVRLQP